MTRRNRWLIPYLTAAVAFVIRWWMSTMRVRIVSADGRHLFEAMRPLSAWAEAWGTPRRRAAKP